MFNLDVRRERTRTVYLELSLRAMVVGILDALV